MSYPEVRNDSGQFRFEAKPSMVGGDSDVHHAFSLTLREPLKRP